MTRAKPIDSNLIRELFYYKDGRLYNKVNRRRVKKDTLAASDGNLNKGYRRVSIRGRTYPEHRLIWALHHGDTTKDLDHINRNRLDNRIENLRVTDFSRNRLNSKMDSRNKSGHTNVYWNKKSGLWFVYLRKNTKGEYFGSYKDKELAALVAGEARDKYYEI